MRRYLLAFILVVTLAFALGFASQASAYCAIENPLGGCLLEVP